MGQQIPFQSSFKLPDGQEIILETGKLGMQSHGSAVVKCGDTILFASIVSNKEAKEGQEFFPLSVDYQEKFAAAGKIPGNFFRRETKLSDYEILVSRMVDRTMRPLFPDNYMNETQIVINLISGDPETMPDALAGLAASTAITCSPIPFDGPISEVRVAKIDGKFVVNPKRTALKNAELDFIIGASKSNLMMVEGECKEVDEADMLEAIRVGHEAIKVQCDAQLALAAQLGEKVTKKREIEVPVENLEIKNFLKENAEQRIKNIAYSASEKQDRKDAFDQVLKDCVEKLKLDNGEDWMKENSKTVVAYFEKLKKHLIRMMVLETGKRLDGRSTTDVRHIWTEVAYLPATHGSAIFTRGETQALTTVTLGTKDDEMLIDNALDRRDEGFFLHYNFPPYSVGEARPMRAPGRREVGHANLASRSLKQIMPDNFPYTVRIVSDILESNGSSSMATVCAGSLALMDAGVPVKSGISGIAMGLITEDGKTAILSDILGDEDALGDMDFKVTGTRKGITGTQMDMKIDGLSFELLAQALEQAKAGRLHVLDKMDETIKVANDDFKPHAPRIVEVIIDKSFIGAVIGPGGKIIQEIQAKTGTKISIEEKDEKGYVNIASNNKESIEAAVKIVKGIAFTPEVGETYEAKVVSIFPYGAFVDFHGKSGLLHVSEISHERIDNVEDALKVGQIIQVKLIGTDPKTNKLRLSRKAILPRK
jgi:polyribonucleotide nucleotidyltransferase